MCVHGYNTIQWDIIIIARMFLLIGLLKTKQVSWQLLWCWNDGTGANFQHMIEAASNESGLTKEQIVVCMCCSI